MKRPLRLVLPLVLPLIVSLTACTTPYKDPVFASSSERTCFDGIADRLAPDKTLDVLLVHGMCTHDAAWAHGAVESLYASLGGGPDKVDLQPQPVVDSPVMLYQQTLQTQRGTFRANAIVWSALTTPLKQQLCYDQTHRSAYCTGDEAKKPYPYVRATLNRELKDGILNDCLSDAMIYQGKARDEINQHMQRAVLQALAPPDGTAPTADLRSLARKLAAQPSAAPLVVVSESLGSKVIFDAIFKLAQHGDASVQQAARTTFDRITHIYMGANQLPILALADQHLDGTVALLRDRSAYPVDPIAELMNQRRLRSLDKSKTMLPAVIAFTDPNDLLSYVLVPSEHRKRQGYDVIDAVASNAPTYLGYVERPDTAHLGYRTNEHVKRLIAHGNARECRR